MKKNTLNQFIKFLCLLLLTSNVFSGGNESDSLLMATLDEVLTEEYKPCSDQSGINSLEINTIPSLMIVSDGSLFIEGEVITSSSGVQAIVDSYDVETQKLTFHQSANTSFETFLLGETITGSSSGSATVKEFIIDLTIPCSELIVSIEDEPQQMIFTPKESAEEAQAAAEVAATEMMAEIEDDLANQAALEAFQQKLAEEKAAAAASTAAYQSQLEYDAKVEELMDALEREMEIDAFEAQLEADLAAQEIMAEILADEELAKRLAEFQAKIEAEKAAAAASTAAYQSQLEYDAKVEELMDALEREMEIDAFEAQLEADLAAQEIMAEILADEELAKRLAEFQAKIEAEKAAAARSTAIYQARQQQEQMIKDRQAQLALERELAEFEAQLEAQLEADLAAQEIMAEILADEELAKRLAEFQAKIEAEKAAAARSTAIYQARQQQEQMIKDRQAQLALERELAEFEAQLDIEFANQAALAKFLANLAEERAAASASTAAYQAKVAYDARVAKIMEDLVKQLEEVIEPDDYKSHLVEELIAQATAKLEEEKFIGAISGEIVTVAIHEFCKDTLNLSDSNITLFKKALAGGYLGNVGPQVKDGTEFTANRWDKYITCVGSLGN